MTLERCSRPLYADKSLARRSKMLKAPAVRLSAHDEASSPGRLLD